MITFDSIKHNYAHSKAGLMAILIYLNLFAIFPRVATETLDSPRELSTNASCRLRNLSARIQSMEEWAVMQGNTQKCLHGGGREVTSVDTVVKDLAKRYWYNYFQITCCGWPLFLRRPTFDEPPSVEKPSHWHASSILAFAGIPRSRRKAERTPEVEWFMNGLSFHSKRETTPT